MKEKSTFLGFRVKSNMRKRGIVLMVPLYPVWFLPWYPIKPGSKSKPTRNQNQYLIPVWVNTETNTNTSPKPESISKPIFEIENSNSIPILKSKPTSFAYPWFKCTNLCERKKSLSFWFYFAFYFWKKNLMKNIHKP